MKKISRVQSWVHGRYMQIDRQAVRLGKHRDLTDKECSNITRGMIAPLDLHQHLITGDRTHGCRSVKLNRSSHKPSPASILLYMYT